MNILYYIVLTLIFIAFIMFIIRKFINKTKYNFKPLKDVISRWWDV